MEELGILGFGILNPGLFCIPLHGATKGCSHPRCSAKLEFIDDFIYLGSVIRNEDSCRGDNNKISPGQV